MGGVVERGRGTAQVMGPWGETREVPEEVQELSLRKMRALYKESPWLERINEAARTIVHADVTHTKRLKMLRGLADRINDAVSKESACRRGCNACCKIQVEMTGWEARVIADELGIKVKEPEAHKSGDSRQRSLELMGRPCGFLKNGECSIYSSRPIACRLHHSLNLDAAMCQPDVPPEESMVPSLNMTVVHMAYAMCSGATQTADIGEFFEEAKRGPSVIERCVDNDASYDNGVVE